MKILSIIIIIYAAAWVCYGIIYLIKNIRHAKAKIKQKRQEDAKSERERYTAFLFDELPNSRKDGQEREYLDFIDTELGY